MGLARQNESLPPPHLSMDEYVEFVGASMQLVDPEKARLQKEIEEDIKVMFSLSNPRTSPPTLAL